VEEAADQHSQVLRQHTSFLTNGPGLAAKVQYESRGRPFLLFDGT
jgi:hypothetical protein